MIRFTDSNYFYTGAVEQGRSKDDYRLHTKHIDELVAQRRYQEAMDYMKQFHFDDVFREQDWKSKIAQVNDMRKQANYLYSDLDKNSPELQAIDFSNLILRPGGWKLIDNNNEYKRRFGEIKRGLGNTSLGQATSLEVEFAPTKQYGNLFGFNVDVLAKDNDINIDNFYKYSGLTEDDLKAAGVAPREKDGRTIITFSKDNDISNQILFGLGALMANEEGRYFNLIGYDADGNRLDEELNDLRNTFSTTESQPAVTQRNAKGEYSIIGENGILNRGFTGKFRDWTSEAKTDVNDFVNTYLSPANRVFDKPAYRDSLTDIYNDIVAGSNVEQKLVDEVNEKKDMLNATYNTTIFGFVSDQVQSEFGMMNRGELAREQFNANKKEYEEVYINQLAGLGDSHYEFYSNWNKPEGALDELNAEDKHKVLNHVLAAYKANRVRIQVAESGGELGAYISIIPQEGKDLVNEKDNETIDIFIPGLWADKAQQRINNDTTFKARKEVQDMELLGYDYKTEDGNTISVKAYNSKGEETSFKSKDSLTRQFFITDRNGNTRPIDKAEALARIDKSNIMEEGVEMYMSKYANLYGKITDEEALKNEAKYFATNAVNSLYPNLIELSKADIFDNPVVRDNKGNIVVDALAENTDADEELSWQAYQKTREAMEIYSYIINNLIYYRQ